MTKKLRAVHYLNQFFGQIGSEDKAHTPPLTKDGPIGPGRLFQGNLRGQLLWRAYRSSQSGRRQFD
jgi:hypothetical protein